MADTSENPPYKKYAVKLRGVVVIYVESVESANEQAIDFVNSIQAHGVSLKTDDTEYAMEYLAVFDMLPEEADEADRLPDDFDPYRDKIPRDYHDIE